MYHRVGTSQGYGLGLQGRVSPSIQSLRQNIKCAREHTRTLHKYVPLSRSMYKFPASKLACELPSAGYIQLWERASRWVRAFSDPGPETQGSPGAHMAVTERNVMWLCVNGGQKILLLGLKTGASPTIVKWHTKLNSVHMCNCQYFNCFPPAFLSTLLSSAL